MYKLSSQITYALRSHAAELAEEEERVSATLGEPDMIESQDVERQGNIEEQSSSSGSSSATNTPETATKRGRGRPKKHALETPTKTEESVGERLEPEVEIPVFHVEPPSVRPQKPQPSAYTPARKMRASLAPQADKTVTASPAANTRSRNRLTSVATTESDEEMITLTPMKPLMKTIRKTRSTSKLAD
jgi:hypothetical protein